MSEWKEYKLGEIALINMGQSPNSESYNFDKKGLPFFQGNRTFGRLYPSIDTYCSTPNKIAEKDDILFSVRAPVGDINYSPEKVCIGRGLCSIRMKNGNQKFLFYLLNHVKQDIINKESGTVFGSVNRSILEGLKVKIPNLSIQTAIAELLSSLDDKIELNNKINQELETLAQTLFKQWFINFEFPNENGEPYKSSGGEMVDSQLGEIPKGWEISSLDKIAEYLNGLALQKYPPENDYEFLPVIKIRELRQKDLSNSDKASINLPEKYIIENGDVLFSWSGSLMIDFWTNGKGALNQHLFKVTSDLFPKWYYYLWSKHHLNEFIEIAESKATTMGHIQRQHLKDAHVLIPENNSIKDFSLVFEPIISKIIGNRIECIELIKMRDSLLPKLISGELEINEISN